jgi:hypothetical protein
MPAESYERPVQRCTRGAASSRQPLLDSIGLTAQRTVRARTRLGAYRRGANHLEANV